MTCILYLTLYFLDSLLLMHETVIYSCSLPYNILLLGYTIIYPTLMDIRDGASFAAATDSPAVNVLCQGT